MKDYTKEQAETMEEVEECARLFLQCKSKIDELQEWANIYKEAIGKHSTEPYKIQNSEFKISVSDSFSKKTDYARMIKENNIDKNKYTTQSDTPTRSVRITPVVKKEVK